MGGRYDLREELLGQDDWRLDHFGVDDRADDRGDRGRVCLRGHERHPIADRPAAFLGCGLLDGYLPVGQGVQRAWSTVTLRLRPKASGATPATTAALRAEGVAPALVTIVGPMWIASAVATVGRDPMGG